MLKFKNASFQFEDGGIRMLKFKHTHDDACECLAFGRMLKVGDKVAVHMFWHMDHSMDKSYQRDFLKTRCRSLQMVFGDLKGAQGIIVKHANGGGLDVGPLDDYVRFVEKHVPRSGEERKVVHFVNCSALMGFVWPNVSEEKWKELKEKFIDVFELATMHGPTNIDKQENEVIISSQFWIAEKGGD